MIYWKLNRREYVLVAIIIFLLCSPVVHAQVSDKEDTTEYNTGDLEKILDRSDKGNTKSAGYYVVATFKSTRVINGHSVENTGKGVLDFRIAHRFGQLNEGIKISTALTMQPQSLVLIMASQIGYRLGSDAAVLKRSTMVFLSSRFFGKR